MAYFGHVMRKDRECLEQIIQGMTPGSRGRGRPKTTWLSNVTSWTGVGMGELFQNTSNRKAWCQLVHSATNPQSENGQRRKKRLLSMV